MWALLGTVFIASVLGSLHCVGMCGPFALIAGANRQGQGSAIIPSAVYSLGRLTTYTIVGIIFGSLGMAINRGTSFAPWQQSATYAAGGLMIVVGMVALARQFGFRVKLPVFTGHMQVVLQSLFKKFTRQPPLRRAFLIGAFSCLMPCGWLYTFAIVAAGTGRPLIGAAVMAVFWAGTVPVMIALPLGITKLGHAFQKRIPVAMASLVIVIGIFTIVFRAPIAIGDETNVAVQQDQLIEQIQNVDHSELPCCSGK